MAGKRRTVTLSDVATLSGVSVAIASQALRGSGRMRDDTRERVLDAAQRLNYRPNALAQSFVSGRSLTIGVIVESLTDIFSMPVVMGVSSELGDRDMAVLVYGTGNDAGRRREIVAKLRSRHADGVIVVGDGTKHSFTSITAEFDVPVVYAFGEGDASHDISFLPDGRGAGVLAGEHLIGIGRSRIAHITAAGDRAAVARAAGLVAALDAAGLSIALGTPLVGDWTQEWGASAASQILRRFDEVDAVFCGNDQIAFGLYRALQQASVRIPEDIAIVGYDHLSKFIDSEPVITTIDPLLAALGVEAARAVLAAREDPLQPGVRYLPGELIAGASTGCARSTTEGPIVPIF